MDNPIKPKRMAMQVNYTVCLKDDITYRGPGLQIRVCNWKLLFLLL